jgi:glucosamine--fructose-6-phosphate aminotransferase (isomerizing)
MLKEIFEQPAAVKETLRGRLLANGQVALPEVKLSLKTWQKLKKVVITACGSSLHAGLIARFPLEQWLQLPVEIDCSSEFRYRSPLINQQTLLIAITQSGETADTLASLRLAKAKGATTLAITNVVGSTAAREADGVIYTYAGPEIGVAATKTLTAQITALLLLAGFMGQKKLLASKEAQVQLAKLAQVPDLITAVLKQAKAVKEIALNYTTPNSFLYLGRGLQYPVALEGALKLKEISYIHAEGYPAGEMKHGPIALITPETPVVAIAVKDRWYQKMLSNIQEVNARGGRLIVIATEGDKSIKNITENVIYVPPVEEFLAPLLTLIPLQLMAYYIAKERGCNVDQPRNLAKSVTVE